jgi:ubiquitin carboxyl-terminal hydrolase 4/11/15
MFFQSVVIHSSAKAAKEPKKTHLTVQDCFEMFVANEKLGSNDQWYCPSCKEHRRAMKKFDLWRLPKVLVIHLKRFQYTRFLREKLGILVDFPIRGFDLSAEVNDPQQKANAIYDLFAVSVRSLLFLSRGLLLTDLNSPLLL